MICNHASIDRSCGSRLKPPRVELSKSFQQSPYKVYLGALNNILVVRSHWSQKSMDAKQHCITRTASIFLDLLYTFLWGTLCISSLRIRRMLWSGVRVRVRIRPRHLSLIVVFVGAKHWIRPPAPTIIQAMSHQDQKSERENRRADLVVVPTYRRAACMHLFFSPPFFGLNETRPQRRRFTSL